MKRIFYFSIIALVLLSCVAFATDRGPRRPAVKVGFDESHNPQAGYTLAANFSKLKQYIENEFGYTVESNTWDWSASTLNQYDIFIIPTRFQMRPTSGELSALNNWMQNGGKLIVLWYSLCEGACTGNLDPPANWPGTGFFDNVLSPNGLGARSQYPGTNDFTGILGTIGTTPNNINRVASQQSAWMGKAEGTGKFLASNNSGQYVASYNPKVGTGKLYLIGSLSAFQNAYIDQADNKKFLINIIHDATGGGGGGGTGAFKVIKVKVKPKKPVIGNNITFITRIKNIGTAASDATQVKFYLSLDDTLDGADIEIGTGSLPALNKGKSKRIKLKVPLDPIASDTYYGIVEIVSDGTTKASSNTVNVQ